jgi:hypothetical protein
MRALIFGLILETFARVMEHDSLVWVETGGWSCRDVGLGN